MYVPGLFQLPVFQSQAFIQYMNGMRQYLQSSKVLYDAKIDAVLPWIEQRMDTIGGDIQLMHQENCDHHTVVKAIPHDVNQSLQLFLKDTVNQVAANALNVAVNNKGRHKKTGVQQYLPTSPAVLVVEKPAVILQLLAHLLSSLGMASISPL